MQGLTRKDNFKVFCLANIRQINQTSKENRKKASQEDIPMRGILNSRSSSTTPCN